MNSYINVARRIWYLPYDTHCDILPFSNNTDSVKLSLKNGVSNMFGLNSTTVKNISMSVKTRCVKYSWPKQYKS